MDLSNKAGIVDWQRHNGVEKLALHDLGRRSFLYPAPVLRQDMSELLDYETNTELGISITLLYRLWRPLYYTEVLAKQMFWLAKHLVDRSDVIDEGVQIRLGITTDVADMVAPYLEACNFPEDNIDWLKSREAIYPQSTKVIHMKHDVFKDMDRVLHMDITLHLDTHETQHKGMWFRNVKNMWTTQPMSMIYLLYVDKIWSDRTMKEWDRNWGLGIPPEDHLLWSRLSEELGEPASDLKSFFLNQDGRVMNVQGYLFGFSRGFLDSLNLETDLYPVMRMGNDEVALEAYAYKHKWENDDVALLYPAFRWLQAEDPTDLHAEYGIRYSDSRTDHEHWRMQYE